MKRRLWKMIIAEFCPDSSSGKGLISRALYWKDGANAAIKNVNPSQQLNLYRETAPVVAGSLTELTLRWGMLTRNFILHHRDSAVEDRDVYSTMFRVSWICFSFFLECLNIEVKKARLILANSCSKKSAFLDDLRRIKENSSAWKTLLI